MEQIPVYKDDKSANNNSVQSEAEETLSITSRFISFRSAYLKIYDKERDTDMRKLLSLAAALATAGALSIGASANGGVVGGVVRAGEDVVNGVVDAGEDIVNGVTGTANGANGAAGTTGEAGTNGAAGGTNGTTGAGTTNGTNGTNGTTGTAGATGTNGTNAANGANGTTTAPGNPNTGVPFNMAAVGAAALGLAGVTLSCRRDG